HPDAKEGVVGNRTLASLYDLIPSVKIPRGQRKIGEWNHGRIVVYPDKRIEHWLNGYKVVEYQRGTPIYQALVARSTYAVWENFEREDRGRKMLQHQGAEISFKSIKFNTLKQTRKDLRYTPEDHSLSNQPLLRPERRHSGQKVMLVSWAQTIVCA